jgi:hypothetical protein
MGGKGSTLNARISGRTRAALDRESVSSGRSVSQVAELWLEQARILNELGPEAIGLADHVWLTGKVWSAVAKVEGDPAQSFAARETLREALKILAARVLPNGNNVALEPLMAVRIWASGALRALHERELDDGQLEDLARDLQRLADGKVHPSALKEWACIADRLEEAAANEDEDPRVRNHLDIIVNRMRRAERATIQSTQNADGAKERAKALLEAMGLK